MKSHFTSEFFAGNRERLHQLFTGTAPIVISAHDLMQRSRDVSFPFHQEPNFWYLTGLNNPGLVLVIDKDKEYIILPERDEIVERFDGALETDVITQRSGVQLTYESKEGWRMLEKRINRSKHVATLAQPTDFHERFGIAVNPARSRLIARLRGFNPDIEILDLRTHFMKMRMIKQPVEITAIEHAIDVTVKTLKDVTRPNKLAKFMYEYQLEAAIGEGFRKRGARGHAYEPIVAGGLRACTIHYLDNDHTFGDNELILIDVGAEVDGYSADISRTVIRGTASKRQRAIFDAVKEVQAFEIGLLRPGVKFVEAEQKARQLMGEKLRELGLIRSIDDDAIYRFWPHASHYLGLDIHDVGDYQVPLQPGMVVTAEPGLYVPEEGIGVRIEDDILITETGNQVLTAGLSRDLA